MVWWIRCQERLQTWRSHVEITTISIWCPKLRIAEQSHQRIILFCTTIPACHQTKSRGSLSRCVTCTTTGLVQSRYRHRASTHTRLLIWSVRMCRWNHTIRYPTDFITCKTSDSSVKFRFDFAITDLFFFKIIYSFHFVFKVIAIPFEIMCANRYQYSCSVYFLFT